MENTQAQKNQPVQPAQPKENQNYDPKVREEYWRKFWEENDVFRFDPNKTDKIFSIDTPPPTVSGKMHLGHSYMYSQMDFVARYKRMQGFNLIYPFGTDDNGLPTKLLIEKEKKVKANHMKRKDFVNLCLESLEQEFRPKYIEDWKRIGTSCDFKLFYTTISKDCQKIAQKSLVDLYRNKRLYRKEAPAMYCPQCQTAISQVECEDKEIASFFNDIVFRVKDENSGKLTDLIVATTRPELLPACVAVFFHPEDSRYKSLAGKKAIVPLFNFEVPLIPDERADPEKGTGIVMCCTFGDKTDMEWQKAHHLPIKEAIGRDGLMTELSGKYKGMKIEEARKEIIKDMKEHALLLNQKPITHAVNVHERCGTPIEFIHSKQWFIRYLDLKDDMQKWGDELNWFPNHMKNRYDNWVKGLEWDWCISRQIPFGVPFPIWYCAKCDEPIFADDNHLPVDPLEDKPAGCCPKCGCTDFVPERDTVNTWVTSSLSPSIAKHLIRDSKVYEAVKDKPMNMRPQGHDIITFWLFTTVVESQLHYHMNPWNDCFITGWALDPQGKKMSKSKGNIIEPQVMVEKYSADCLRLWAAGTKLGEDMPFQEKDFIGAKKTTTKIFNATKFAVMHLSDIPKEDLIDYDYDSLEEMDKWILAKAQEMIKVATDSFEVYEFSKAKAAGENFFWHDLCDNYLEICKDRLYNPDRYENGKDKRKSAQIALYHSLLSVLKVLAPFASFITDEAYHMKFSEIEGKKSIHISKWPEYNKAQHDDMAIVAGDSVVEAISVVRKYKSERQKSMNAPVTRIFVNSGKKTIEAIEAAIVDFKATIKADEVVFNNTGSDGVISVDIVFKEA